jgi:DNA helicase HerA-like ATPase
MRSRAAHAAARAVGERQEHPGTIGAAISDDDLLDALPADALDERIAIVGTAGSGKTYAAKGFVERLLDSGARVAIVAPLGVWWGIARERPRLSGRGVWRPPCRRADHRRNGDGSRTPDRQRSARL